MFNDNTDDKEIAMRRRTLVLFIAFVLTSFLTVSLYAQSNTKSFESWWLENLWESQVILIVFGSPALIIYYVDPDVWESGTPEWRSYAGKRFTCALPATYPEKGLSFPLSYEIMIDAPKQGGVIRSSEKS